jgi:D-xylose 1-dehydrogenase (NADP+, D-xylono-1,5-lactone-forming)
MSARTLRWGLISTARINRSLIPPIKASKRSSLIAVASRSEEKAATYAREWEIPKAYGSYDELLNDSEIDIVYIPLPNSMHAEWSIRAAEAGKHVLCEKPLALSLEEVDGIINAAEKAGIIAAEAFMYRYHLQTLKVKELVETGQIGDLLVIRGSFTFNLDRPGDVRLDPALGGGSLWDVGCYPLSYACYIAGSPPTEVFGRQVTGETGIDQVFSAQLSFSNDVFAHFDCSFRIPYQTYMEILGSEAILRVNHPFKPEERETLILKSRAGKEKKILVRGPDAYVGEVQSMEAAVLDNRPPDRSLRESRETVASILALLESARRGTPVGLDLQP